MILEVVGQSHGFGAIRPKVNMVASDTNRIWSQPSHHTCSRRITDRLLAVGTFENTCRFREGVNVWADDMPGAVTP